MSWDGLNRRKFPRVNYPCLVVIRHNEGEQDIILTHTENIGIGGTCIVLKQSIDMFSEVELELDLLDLGDHIKCKGKVVWNVQRKGDATSKPFFYDIGIEFEDIELIETKRIEEVVARLVQTHGDVPYR